MVTLELRGVETGYGKSRVLSDVSLIVNPGEIVAVVGRNGMGKTTLMKAVIGLLECSTGRIIFDSADLARLLPYHRVRLGIGYVPQGREIFGSLTVEENLRVGLRKSRIPAPGALGKLYELFPFLKERRAQLGGTLSGGQQQMLAIARALAGAPRLLLLDEPTEGLQPSTVQAIEGILREVNTENRTTILLTEQNLDIVFKLANRCHIIEKGRLVKEVLPSQLGDEELIKTYLVV